MASRSDPLVASLEHPPEIAVAGISDIAVEDGMLSVTFSVAIPVKHAMTINREIADRLAEAIAMRPVH